MNGTPHILDENGVPWTVTEVPRGTSLCPDSVCRILEMSAKTGVAELTYCDLHVRFGRPAEQTPDEQLSGVYVNQNRAKPSVTDLTDEQHATQNAEALEQAEVETREDQIERLLIEDPIRAEELLRDGELDDGDGAKSDDESE